MAAERTGTAGLATRKVEGRQVEPKGQCPEKTVARTPAAEESHIPGLICNQDGQRASSAATVTPVDAPGQHVPKHEVIGTADGHEPRNGQLPTRSRKPPKPSQCPCADEGISKQGRCTAGRAAQIIDRRFIPQVWRGSVTSAKNDDRDRSRSPRQDPGRNEDARKGQP